MLAVDRLREKAREYELNARAYADRPGNESKLSALTFSAISIALSEVADALEHDHKLEEAA